MTRLGTVVLIATAAALTACGPPQAKTLQFSGYNWIVRDRGYGSPGDNAWSGDNVFVDASGALHLKLTYAGANGARPSCTRTSPWALEPISSRSPTTSAAWTRMWC